MDKQSCTFVDNPRARRARLIRHVCRKCDGVRGRGTEPVEHRLDQPDLCRAPRGRNAASKGVLVKGPSTRPRWGPVRCFSGPMCKCRPFRKIILARTWGNSTSTIVSSVAAETKAEVARVCVHWPQCSALADAPAVAARRPRRTRPTWRATRHSTRGRSLGGEGRGAERLSRTLLVVGVGAAACFLASRSRSFTHR